MFVLLGVPWSVTFLRDGSSLVRPNLHVAVRRPRLLLMTSPSPGVRPAPRWVLPPNRRRRLLGRPAGSPPFTLDYSTKRGMKRVRRHYPRRLRTTLVPRAESLSCHGFPYYPRSTLPQNPTRRHCFAVSDPPTFASLRKGIPRPPTLRRYFHIHSDQGRLRHSFLDGTRRRPKTTKRPVGTVTNRPSS